MTGSMARRIIAGLALVVGLLGLAAATTAADAGPAARWALDETSGAVANDAVGSLDGAIHGANHVGDGFAAGAFRFDGSDDTTIPSSSIIRAADMALSLWVRADPDAAPAAGEVIIDNGNVLCGGSGYALVVTQKWAKVVFRQVDAPGGIVTIQPASTINLPSLWDGAWHHVVIGAASLDSAFVYLFIDGWHVANSDSPGIAYGASPAGPLVIGNDDANCGPGYVGDIDDVRIYDRLAQRDELAGLEPEIETTLDITSVEPGAVQTDANITDWFDLGVTLQPVPAMPGAFWVYVTGEDGVERAIQRFDIGLGNLSADGHYDLAYFANYGGDSTIRVAYVPEVPALPSEDSEAVEIAKAESFTRVVFESIVLDSDPIKVGVAVSPTARVTATGTVELWDVTHTPTLLGEADVFSSPGSWTGSAVFDLPPRPAGEYEFEARYFGSAANLPSVSGPRALDVLPGLETGAVSINGGATTTDDPVVEVSAPATGAIALLITTDPSDIRRQFQLPYTETFTTWLTQPWYGDDADGVRTIWVKWADAKSHWSDWSTDTIVLDRPPAGTTTIDGGHGYTTDSLVSVAVPIADASHVDAVELSNDGTNWTTLDYRPSVAWSLPAGAGTKTVRARWVNTDGKASMSVADSIVLDSSKPSTTAPAMSFAVGWRVADGKVPVRLTWMGSDATSGIARYELARSKDGGAFSTVAKSLTGAANTRLLPPGHSYRFRVRAVDKAGNVGSWAYGSTFRLSAAQNSNSRISYTGTWKTATSSSFWGGSSRYSVAAGAKAKITVTARSFAWIASVGPTRGTARVYVNGTLVATVNLQSTSGVTRRVVFSKTWATSATRTVVIRVSGTTGHPRVDVDAMAWGT